MKSGKPEPPHVATDIPPAGKKPKKGMTRKAFGELLKRAISPAPSKPAPKSP